MKRMIGAALLAFVALAPPPAAAHCHLQYQVIGPAGLFYEVNLDSNHYLGLLPGGTPSQLGSNIAWTDERLLDINGTISVGLTATDTRNSVSCSQVSMNLGGPPSCSDDSGGGGHPPCTPSFTITQTGFGSYSCSSSCASYPQPYVSPVNYTLPASPAPLISSLFPSSATAPAPPLALSLAGSGFVGASQAQWNGTPLTTVWVNGSSLLALVPPALTASPAVGSVSVLNPGGASSGTAFAVNAPGPVPNPVPTLVSLSPSSATAGGPGFTLAVSGTNFISSSTVQWNGLSLSTTYVSSTVVTAAIPAGDIASSGTASVAILNPAPGGGVSSGTVFAINAPPPTPNPVPTLVSLSPSSATAGGPGFTLTAYGTNFISSSTVRWNGSARATTFGSASTLIAAIPSRDIVSVGTASVTVFTPGPGGGSSGPAMFAILGATPTAGVPIGPAGGTLVFDAPSGPAVVRIPSGAFTKPVTVTLSVPRSFTGPTSSITALKGTGVGLQIISDPPVEPAVNVAISLSFRPSDVSGLNTRDLMLARFDQPRGIWVPLASFMDSTQGVITAQTDHFSIFQIMGASPSSTVSTVKAFPNPLRPAQGQTTMTFALLPEGARVRIYDLRGVLVRDITANSMGTATWDGTNEFGSAAASGVYFVFAEGAGEKRTFKVAVER